MDFYLFDMACSLLLKNYLRNELLKSKRYI